MFSIQEGRGLTLDLGLLNPAYKKQYEGGRGHSLLEGRWLTLDLGLLNPA